jgi:hypothetical protein
LSIGTFDLTTDIVGIGGILVGVIPYFWNRHRWKADGGRTARNLSGTT